MQTLEVVREARFAAAFTFQYSIRPGTPAATMPDQVPPAVVRERYERLVEVVNEISWAENQRARRLARRAAGRRGRGSQGRRHPPPDRPGPRQPAGALRRARRRRASAPGDVVEVEVTYAAPHHLVADGPVLAHRRTRSGDAWEARTARPRPSRRPPSASACPPSAPRLTTAESAHTSRRTDAESADSTIAARISTAG